VPWGGAWTISVCDFGCGLLAGAGFDAAPDEAAAVCVDAGLGFPAVGGAAGVAGAAGSLPPKPNHLPIVRQVDVDSVGCSVRLGPGATAATVVSGWGACGGLTFAGNGPDGALTSRLTL